MKSQKHISKLKSFFYNDIKDISDISILEFGVRGSNSTSFFLDICNKNNEKLQNQPLEYGQSIKTRELSLKNITKNILKLLNYGK